MFISIFLGTSCYPEHFANTNSLILVVNFQVGANVTPLCRWNRSGESLGRSPSGGPPSRVPSQEAWRSTLLRLLSAPESARVSDGNLPTLEMLEETQVLRLTVTCGPFFKKPQDI